MQMEIAEIFRENARRGGALLDRKNPQWRRQVTRPVLISSHTDCPLGQVYGDFSTGLSRLFLHGFSWCSSGEAAVLEEEWARIAGQSPVPGRPLSFLRRKLHQMTGSPGRMSNGESKLARKDERC
jgi:hypothetical protein